GANSGTMTTGYDMTNRRNYYKWTTTSASDQDYDIVVQVPIPKDFDAWATNPVTWDTYTTNSANAIATVQILKSTGAADSHFTTFQSLTWSNGNWTTSTTSTLDAVDYTAGDYMTIRIRMKAKNNDSVQISNIKLNYLGNR
ncbi:MAG: hypothetical protein ACSLEY_00910, partial [Candidatus Saccharimonadales bacterium]